MPDIGSAIRRHRIGSGTDTNPERSGADLAAAAGLSQGAVSKWERGLTYPTVEHVAALERALGLRRGQLFIEGGYVDSDMASVEAAIDLTDDLSPPLKRALKATYRSLAGR